jgi:hypothetical protein
LDRERLANQRVQILAESYDFPPRERCRCSDDAEFLADLLKDFTRKECNLSLVIFLVVKESIATDSTAGDTFNLGQFLQWIRSGRLTVMLKEIVPTRYTIAQLKRKESYFPSLRRSNLTVEAEHISQQAGVHAKQDG